MQTREQVIEEAVGWVGTPYLVRGMVKGGGCDCFTFVVLVMMRCGLMEVEEIPVYAADWWAHTSVQHYLRRVMKFAKEKHHSYCFRDSVTAQPGDIALVRAAPNVEVFNHGGIVKKWPRVLHCAHSVEEVDASRDPLWQGREILILDPFVSGAKPFAASA